MPKSLFSHVATWVFDLDNTLYPPQARLFDQIEVKMTQYVMDSIGVDRAEADRLRKHYWREYGTTLAGLMQEHGVDPAPYLTDVHEISLHALEPDADLRRSISALPGRKIVYTNGSAPYAGRVLKARGLDEIFDAVYGVEHADFHPKPRPEAFQRIFERDGLDPRNGAMFEDDPRNLKVPHALGMRTVHVAPEAQEIDYIHHHTPNLGDFIAKLVD
ncbi:pyrimidine 5'-nucleotidase [Rhodalgimonas zhirmunskyi]|uniref:Pyrimidine 5'-nucleotidase n=1 Tax=Rhodalgimonas zhirmunskyi TaxID=2964767 RepID=A0AAJ1U4E8_9RHOB|nr:pyrimidine 5'-nucleotidase [Rhodoalgimonas zhirmunskyi]MDQ2093496.1 pyrimidine 5'-nucleotidase [Rhodoalgimonas zhirmunskyi]